MAYYVASGLDRYGGDDGQTIYHRSNFGAAFDLNNKTLFYYLCFAVLLAALYFVWRLVNSRFGMVIRGTRSNERRMRAIGFPTFRYKLVCFVIGGAICGLAGALLANHTNFISPAMMHWTRSGDLIVMAVLGGMQALFGPLIGAMDVPPARRRPVARYPNIRIYSWGRYCLRLRSTSTAASMDCSEARVVAAALAEPLLEIDALTKRFGGVTASDNISLKVPKGELHAIIGPNGAGKTTLIGQLAGEITPDAGRIVFDGSDITALPVHRRSQIGLARSFQITSLFPDFTALDNVALAVQAHAGHSFRFWRDARSDDALRQPAREVLDELGLSARADIRVANLSHGERRQLEIAMALVTQPRLLLLDEPMAGMGPDESARLVDTLRQLKGSFTILLIEHDMDAVFALADRISVLVYGRIIASGDAATIRTIRQCAKPISASMKPQGRGRDRETEREPRMAEALLELRDVETSYGLSRVLFGVSLSIASGEMVSLLGRNGMGKTTTVRSIMGLTPALGGSIHFAGTDIRDLPPYRVAKLGLGLVPEGRQVFPNLTVRENLVRLQSIAATHRVRGHSIGFRNFSRASPNAGIRWRTSCPAASSKCSRSGGP